MCGIVGYFRLRDDSDLDLRLLVARARDQMTHRGPDASGLYSSPDGRCVLGSRRLSIRDLSDAGLQPMSNEDETRWVVFNGEIYNADALRERLLRAGHRFRSRCDTEVLVHLYEERHADMVDDLDGMFSFVIYDRTTGTLFGARDRLGIKPLYYALSSSRFAFASEPKALLSFPDVSRKPRIEEISSYLTFACLPGPPTLHSDIHKLEPGTRFEISAGRGFRAQRYWHFPPSIDDGSTATELEAALDAALSQAVAKRNIADVRVGATMSGGIDSGLVVAHMTELRGTAVPTFTIGYPGDDVTGDTDLLHARILAAAFGTEHHEIVLDDGAFEQVLDDLPALADDPNGSPSMAAILHLAKQARRNDVRVLQIGEGADEAFGGYGGPYRLSRAHDRLTAFSRLMPAGSTATLGRSFGNLLGRALRELPFLDGSVFESLVRYSRNEPMYWGHGTVFNSRQQRILLAGRSQYVAPHERLLQRLAWEEGIDDRPYMDQLALIDMVLQLPERLLMRADRATMRYGVEARVPFLDPEVLRVGFRIPPRLRARTPKGFLRAYARAKLPATVVERRKSGFPAARGIFLAPGPAARIRERVLAKPFLELTGLAPPRVAELVAAQARGRGNGVGPLWTLYTLSLWAHHWT